MFDDLIEGIQFALLILIELFHNQLLSVCAIIHLLLKFLYRGLHPVSVIFCCVQFLTLELHFNVPPYLSHLEMRIHLDHL